MLTFRAHSLRRSPRALRRTILSAVRRAFRAGKGQTLSGLLSALLVVSGELGRPLTLPIGEEWENVVRGVLAAVSRVESALS